MFIFRKEIGKLAKSDSVLYAHVYVGITGRIPKHVTPGATEIGNACSKDKNKKDAIMAMGWGKMTFPNKKAAQVNLFIITFDISFLILFNFIQSILVTINFY